MKKRFTIIGFLLIQAVFTYAQNPLKQEVTVVKAYEPVINDAFKISELPHIVDTQTVKASFQYEILPIRHQTTFVPTPIKPAKLINEPLPKIYYGYVKGGLGTYLSPLAQVMVGSNRSEKWNWNAMAHYYSTNGTVKTKTNEKVYAGLSNLQSSFTVNHFTKKSKTMSFGASYQNRVNYYYGNNPLFADSLNLLLPTSKKDIEQQIINKIGGNFGLSTNYLDSSHVNFSIHANWQTLKAKNNIGENQLIINSGFNYFFEKEFIGTDVDIHYRGTSGLEDTVSGAIVRFSPWVGAFGKKWRILAGVNTFFDQTNEEYHFYPRISMHYNIIDYFLIPYFELDGSFQENSYSEIYEQNNYVQQTLSVEPTDVKLNMTLGFRGNISSKVAFNAKINYTEINNQYFFVNDTSLLWDNKFTTTSDNITRIRVLSEISYKTSQKLWFSVKANYYTYELTNESHPWHLPEFNLSFNARYKIQEKIVLEANVFAIGKRYARQFDSNNQVYAKELPGMIDLNVGIEYRLSKRLSAFGTFNNLSSVAYEQWNQYPTQRFNLMVGASYSF